MAAAANLGVSELLGQQLLCKKGDKYGTIETSTLQGKFICLYFSAHWCPPCRAFTPVLRKWYLAQQAAGKPIELIYVSSDNTQAEFDDYYGSNMVWLAVPFEKSNLRTALARRFKILGIPTLVILDPSGHIVNKNARGALSKDPEGKGFPWPGQEDAMGGTMGTLVVVVILALLYWLFLWKQ